MRVELFDFDLPPERIAQAPVTPRDRARLLVVDPSPKGGGFEDRTIRDLPSLLQPGDLLVFNDTRVIPSRLTGKRENAKVEVTLHKCQESEAKQQRWLAFAKPARKLEAGDIFTVAEDFAAEMLAKREEGEVVLRFPYPPEVFWEKLARYGALPLPPYIRREGGNTPDDAERYQTVFAAKDGAVAAPTAGLHFTPELLSALAERGVGSAFMTLHVGAGTFLPVKAEDTREHRMHSEYGIITQAAADAINAARAKGGRIVAVGTTSLRLLESAVDEEGRTHPFAGETDIFITPGYRFKAVDLLLTNFHLPRSTLFMLVCAFAGMERMKAAYKHAIESGYRFYSYGDACLLGGY